MSFWPKKAFVGCARRQAMSYKLGLLTSIMDTTRKKTHLDNVEELVDHSCDASKEGGPGSTFHLVSEAGDFNKCAALLSGVLFVARGINDVRRGHK